jgi:Asp-tRNA(Asn)/Glu-tRNA(Gln) amidotransferase A subunit family amidase
MKQAEAMDDYRRTGRPIGALHGLPVAIKDIFDTTRIPSENGTAADSGRIPLHDAAVVERLKSEGAIILGKTATVELAYLGPVPTKNPADHARTAGGSSSGSAAAVAAGMAPLAIGSQTEGSITVPASYCGVTGYKPTFGTISRRGMLSQAPSLDTVGVFARSPQDAALLAETLAGHDDRDSATAFAPNPRLLETALSKPPVKPDFALVRTPFWDEADEQLRDAFVELAGFLGENCFEAELPGAFNQAKKALETIGLAEMAKSFAGYHTRKKDALGPAMIEAIETGNSILARDYLAALDWPRVYNAGLDEIFERCDVILTPAVPGPAPEGTGTGNPVFAGLWSLCGLPTVTLPLLEAQNGMPMGVQLVGPKGSDGRLLRTARWLSQAVAGAE